ncbi:cache domain-containing sensor histidine kinase [Paenibacillus contaminans]|uniref:HAMP domain-containing protein n=1 Tax=Paenibacillus contaminans TaxID=450362 RepID=A0A329MSF3_9BACL|nr:sensor histidine kinase [Paenibacillus contaminans]RAV22909.1 hypothetical protein DQG23_01505 [Paenibacillus contaminans]
MKRNSLQQRIFMASITILLIVYGCSAWASYYLSVSKISAEKEKQLSNVTKRVAQNLSDMFDQTEKVALLVSQNGRLLDQMTAHYADDNAELAKLQNIESTLSGMILQYPHIESILVSFRNENTYMFTFGTTVDRQQSRELNLFRNKWADAVLAGEKGVWRSPDANGGEMPSLFHVLLGEKFVFSKRINDNAVVSLAVSPAKIKSLLTQTDSPFGYEVSAYRDAAAVVQAGSGHAENSFDHMETVRLEKYGLELRTWIDSEASAADRLHQVRNIAILAFLLSAVAFVLSGWFAHRMVNPIRQLKRQVEDIYGLSDSVKVIDYQIKHKFPVSFRLKMFLYLLAVSALGTFVLFAVNFVFSKTQIRENLKQYYFEYLSQSENSIEFNLKNTERFAASILRDGTLQELMRGTEDKEVLAGELKALFSYQQVIDKNINYLNVYGSDGEIVFSTINSSLNEQPVEKRNIYPLLKESRGETVYFNEKQDPFGNHVISIAKKIMSTTYPSTLLGYYILTVIEGELSYLSSNLGIMLLDFMIVGTNGDIIFNKDNSAVEDIMAVPGVFTQTKGAQEARINGQNKLVMFDEMSDTNWKIISTVDASELNQGEREITLAYGYTLLVILFALFCVIYFLSGSISRPIRMLMFKIRETVEDHFQGRMPLLAGTDEIAELSQHLYAMIQKIQFLMNDIYTVEVKNREIQLEFKKAELANLIHQINPHFLYNTMETIKWMAMELTGSENRVTKIIGELSVFLRFGIHSDMRTVWVDEELAHVSAYLYIQQIRYGERLRVKWDIDPAARRKRIAKFVLQPIVENALLHGIDPKRKAGIVSIRIAAEGGSLMLEVTDNGAGIDSRTLERLNDANPASDDHVGLANIRRRLVLLYGEHVALTVSSKPGYWTKVTILVAQADES